MTQLEQKGLIPVVRIRLVLSKEPVLNRRERYRPFFAPGDQRAGLRTVDDYSRETPYARILEDLSRRELQSCLMGARHDLQTENRIAAQLEKIVVRSDLRYPEHRGPDCGELAFCFAGERHAPCDAGIRRGPRASD